MNEPQNPASVPLLPLTPILTALGGTVRWSILAELVQGESLMVVELAERLNESPSLVSKHLAVLRKAGMVESGRSGLYRLPAHFPVSSENRTIDFGHCLLRFGKETNN